MAKHIPPAILDLMLQQCEGDTIHLCSAQPSSYADAASNYNLASRAIGSVNYTRSNGDVSGRKQVLTPPAAATINASGTANHVAVTQGSTLKLVTTCNTQAITAGDGATVDIGSFPHEIRAPQ